MKRRRHFGKFGGRYVPEMLIPALDELEKAYYEAKDDVSFKRDLIYYLKHFSGRPTPLVYLENLSKHFGGARIYLKNEGLNHTGAHKITHCLGQALLAKRMGKKRLIAETGAGQHGLATATVAAKFGFSCTVYMGERDVCRQRPNVFLMERLGATVVPVTFGNRTLKDAVNAAIKDWIENVEDSYYLLGSVVGAEVKRQITKAENRPPDFIIACVGGGSNAMGIFHPFIKHKQVKLVGVEAGGRGKKVGDNAVRLNGGSVGVVEGFKSYFLQDLDGQIQKTYSISAGLDYAGIGPELAYLKEKGRIEFTSASDKAVLSAFDLIAKYEGIIPALESAHALAEAFRLAPTLSKEKIIVVNLSGRGDKDLFILAKAFNDQSFFDFLAVQKLERLSK